MSQLSMTHFAPARSTGHGVGWSHLADRLRVMLRTWTTRRLLLEMTSRELADIGISRSVALGRGAQIALGCHANYPPLLSI